MRAAALTSLVAANVARIACFPWGRKLR